MGKAISKQHPRGSTRIFCNPNALASPLWVEGRCQAHNVEVVVGDLFATRNPLNHMWRAAIYGQVTVGDIVIARYTADAWRGRIYAVRYFLTFVSSGAAVSAIAFLHSRGGFDLVLTMIAACAAVLLVAVLGFVGLVSTAETRRSVQPAE